MIILNQILDHDLHRTNKGVSATPLMVETPAQSEFVPAIISSTQAGRFLVSRRLTKEKRLRSGVFHCDPDRIDEMIRPLMNAAYDLSKSEKYPNRFISAALAFDYVKATAGTGAHPHIVLIPQEYTDAKIKKNLGVTSESKTGSLIYKEFCRVIMAPVDFPVFFSRPDYVGLYTQFLGGDSSIFLHNVRQGMAFVHPDAK